MLKCEDPSEAMGDRVEAAAKAYFDGEYVSVFFEHGQWWAQAGPEREDYATYSVVDATGGDSVDGFCFELVSPREDC